MKHRLHLLVALATAAPAVAAQRPEDPSRVAIRTIVPVDLAELAARAGADLRGARRFGPADVLLLELAEPLDHGARRALLARLVAAPEIDFASLVELDGRGNPGCASPFVLARFEADVPETAQRAVLSTLPDLWVARERFGGMDGAWRLESTLPTGAEVVRQAAELAALPGLRWAHVDRIATGVTDGETPDDPLFPMSWGLDNTGQTVAGVTGLVDFDMDVAEAWDVTLGSSAVIVAVMDVGAQLDHPDLNVGFGADLTGSGTTGWPVNPCANHGTAVAGCIASRFDNGIGTAGVAPLCVIASGSIGIDTCDGKFSQFSSWNVDALEWAESIGASITNWSVSLEDDDAVSDKLSETWIGGMMHFAAAGNKYPEPMTFPATHAKVCSVGGTKADGTKYSGSQVGPKLDLAAPAVNVQTADRTGMAGYDVSDYTVETGTSFATPYAAGVAALVRSVHPWMPPTVVRLLLEMSATDLGAPGQDDTYGFGHVNARAVLVQAAVMAAGFQAGYEIVLHDLTPSVADVYQAVTDVEDGGHVIIHSGSYGGSLILDGSSKACTLWAWDAPVVLGK